VFLKSSGRKYSRSKAGLAFLWCFILELESGLYGLGCFEEEMADVRRRCAKQILPRRPDNQLLPFGAILQER